jgi:very-short-patch-repair endonuclease
MGRKMNRPQVEDYRRKLRKTMTPAEVTLWMMIKNRQLAGERFLRQYSIDCFIVDFYCPKYKLAIELDGEGHNSEEQQEYDNRRTSWLNGLGIKVLRFENFEIFNYPQRTLDEISIHIETLKKKY